MAALVFDLVPIVTVPSVVDSAAGLVLTKTSFLHTQAIAPDALHPCSPFLLVPEIAAHSQRLQLQLVAGVLLAARILCESRMHHHL